MTTMNIPQSAAPQQRAPAVHDGLAVASLVLGLAWLGGLGALLAVIFGHVSRQAARAAGRKPSGLATAGLVLGYAGLALAIILVIVLIAMAGHVSGYQDCLNQAKDAGIDPAVYGCAP